jgi:PAS domain S-box-containing protein
LGLISVDAPRDNLQPDTPIFETLEIFAGQAELVIESRQQLELLETQIASLNDSLQQQIASESSPQVVEKLTRTARHINSGLEIIDLLNLQPDRGAVLDTLGREFRRLLGFDIVLVVEPGPAGPQLAGTHGEIPAGVSPEALIGQRNPLTLSLQRGELMLVPELDREDTQSPLLAVLNTRGYVCIPVRSQARIEATLLAISHQPLPPFTEEEQQLYELIGRQTAAALNNLNLLEDTAQRLEEVNLLLDFSRQLGSLEPEHILRTLLESAMPANAGVVALYDPAQNLLVPQTASGYSNNAAMLAISYRPGEALPGRVFVQGRAVRVDEMDFAHQYNLVLDDLLRYREATGGRLPISSLVIPILSGENKLGVLVLENFRETAAFTAEDQALIASLAQQSALTLENVRLYQAAEGRAAQLQALSDAAATLRSHLQPETLVQSLLDSLEGVIPFDTGTLWLREANKLTIQSARGYENSADLVGISTTVEDSQLFHEMIETSQPITVRDVRVDPRFPGSEAERLSWIGVPLISKGEVIGVFALEKTEAEFYTAEHTQVAMTFASQAAVSLDNANLLQQSLNRAAELDQRTQRLAQINRFSNHISSSLELDYLLNITVQELQSALPGSGISAVLWQNGKATLQAEMPQVAASLPVSIPVAPVFGHLEQTLGVFSTQNTGAEATLSPLRAFLAERKAQGLLILPLSTGEQIHGFMLVHTSTPHRFSADEIELALIITNQAAVAIQNALLFLETRRLTEELELRVAERTEQLGREHQRIQTLLRIMQELSASLDLDHILNRTLALLNDTTGAEQSTILLVRPEDASFYLRASLGYTDPTPQGGRPTSIRTDDGIAGWVIKNREGVLIDDIHNDERWVKSGILSEHRSAIVSPLMVGAEALGAMLLFHRLPGRFSPDQRELVQAAANQIAIAINNTELFNLIREQAESLGGMLRTQQVEASRSRAILEAVADGVLVTDANNIITLFNESAQQILNLKRSDVLGHSLEDFTGLFGKAARTWTETIRQWSTNPASYEAGETYAEQITLDNSRVVSIHLAAVVMRNEFLGSVSTFRDITHQVEVDRLKSEFVATVSHELRTPMTSIKGYVDILLMGAAGKLSDQQSQFLQIVKSNTERLNVLVNDLLDVSRIEAGKVTLSFQPLDIRALIDEVIKEQTRRANEDRKAMEFSVDLAPDLPSAPGDLERVRQIVANLVSNAYNYTPAGGHVTVRAQKKENEIQIDVEDNGIGIPPEDQKQIFERFFRGEDPLVLATAGTGLGLSITQQLIEMHHGRLWLVSSGIPGKGSIFSFTLPLQQPEQLFSING